jgi:Ca2+-binding EF-hand superfamily protein
LSVVCLFATSADAQFNNGAPVRGAAKPAEATQKKTANEKGRPSKVPAAEQAAADTELADALLIAMDTDHDGVVTKLEYREALKALGKVHKDKQGNMAVPDKAATDPNAVKAADAGLGQGPGGVGAPATADDRNNKEVMGRFMQWDTNHDGVLSPNEVPVQSRAMLREADTNRDGVIDAAEMQAFSRRMGDRMKAFSAGAAGVPGDGRKP